MRFNNIIAATALHSIALTAGPAHAQNRNLKSGELVYTETCAACHATGLLKAPRFADKKAWGPLIKEPQADLTADGWVGVRDMPARGGKPDLALEEFARAVAYMARAAGAKWADPDAAMMKRIEAEEKKALAKKSKLKK